LTFIFALHYYVVWKKWISGEASFGIIREVIKLAETSLLTEGVKGFLGAKVGPQVYEIEKGMIRRFCEAVEDPNPLWLDETYAGKTNYGGTVAPPTFAATAIEGPVEEMIQLLMTEMPSDVWHVDGGTSYEYLQPVKVGDVISVTGKIVEIQERKGKRMGNMLYTVFELTSKNQRGEVVATSRRAFFHY
jgi:acyl dehydratase